MLIRPYQPLAPYLLRQWQYSFLTSGFPIRLFQVDITILPTGRGVPPHRGGAPICGILKISVFWTTSSISLFRALSGNFSPASLVFRYPQLHGFDHYGQYKLEGTHSLSLSSSGPLMWLQAQNIALRPRHIPPVFDCVTRLLIQTNSANNNRVESPFRDHDPGLGTPAVDMFGHPSSSVHVSDSLALALDALSHG